MLLACWSDSFCSFVFFVWCGPLSCSFPLCTRPSRFLCFAFLLLARGVSVPSIPSCNEARTQLVPATTEEVAQQVVVGCRCPWSVTPRPSMDEDTVVAEGLVPAVASTLLEDVPFFVCPQVFVLLRLSCTVGQYVLWPFVFMFAGYYAANFVARVFLWDVLLLFGIALVAASLDSAVAWLRNGPLPLLTCWLLQPFRPALTGVSGCWRRSPLCGGGLDAASYCPAARDRPLAVGFKWSVLLGRRMSRLVSSVSCGVEPPRLWAVLVGFGVSYLELSLASPLPGLPLGLKNASFSGA